MKGLPYGGDIMEAMRRQDRDAIRQIMEARNKAQGYEKAKPAAAKRRNLVCTYCAFYNFEGEKRCEMCESSLRGAKTDNTGKNPNQAGSSIGKAPLARKSARDRRKNRHSSIETFREGLYQLGSTTKGVFDAMDKNQDGKISRSEFKKVHTAADHPAWLDCDANNRLCPPPTSLLVCAC